MMEEIKGLVEGHPSSRAALMIQPIAWACLMLLIPLYIVRVLRGQRWPISLVLLLVSACTLSWLAFAQPAAWVSVALTSYLWFAAFVPEAAAAGRASPRPAQRLRVRL